MKTACRLHASYLKKCLSKVSGFEVCFWRNSRLIHLSCESMQNGSFAFLLFCFNYFRWRWFSCSFEMVVCLPFIDDGFNQCGCEYLCLFLHTFAYYAVWTILPSSFLVWFGLWMCFKVGSVFHSDSVKSHIACVLCIECTMNNTSDKS